MPQKGQEAKSKKKNGNKQDLKSNKKKNLE